MNYPAIVLFVMFVIVLIAYLVKRSQLNSLNIRFKAEEQSNYMYYLDLQKEEAISHSTLQYLSDNYKEVYVAVKKHLLGEKK